MGRWIGLLFAGAVAASGLAQAMPGASGAVLVGQQPLAPAADWAFFGYGKQGQVVVCLDDNVANARAGRCPSGFLSPEAFIKKRWPQAGYLGFSLVPVGFGLGLVLYYQKVVEDAQ